MGQTGGTRHLIIGSDKINFFFYSICRYLAAVPVLYVVTRIHRACRARSEYEKKNYCPGSETLTRQITALLQGILHTYTTVYMSSTLRYFDDNYLMYNVSLYM